MPLIENITLKLSIAVFVYSKYFLSSSNKGPSNAQSSHKWLSCHSRVNKVYVLLRNLLWLLLKILQHRHYVTVCYYVCLILIMINNCFKARTTCSSHVPPLKPVKDLIDSIPNDSKTVKVNLIFIICAHW